MFHVIHGNEEFRRSEVVARYKAEVLDEGVGDLNITVLDGRRVDLAEVMNCASAFPFLASRRLVIVEGLLQRYEKRTASEDEIAEDALPPPVGDEMARLAAYLPAMPETTYLVLVESRTISARNPVLALAAKHPAGKVDKFEPLMGSALSQWVTERAGAIGVRITTDALREMLSRTGNDLRRIDGELHKLAAYAAYARPITADDVRELVPEDVAKAIWNLVDALGNRQAARALNLLEDNIDQRDPRSRQPLYYLAMFSRQIRQILMLKDLIAQGVRADRAQQEMGLSDYPFARLQEQARKFAIEELEGILRRVLEIDQAYKTGRTDGFLALELLVLEVCARRRPAEGRSQQASRRSRTRSASATSFSSPEPRSR